MALESEISKLKERDAKLVSHSRNPLTGDWELVTKWDVADRAMQESLIKVLYQYTSVGPGGDSDTITNESHLTARQFVDNPVVNGIPYQGRWRLVTVAPQPPGARKDPDGVYRVLRRGYMMTLDWAEARLLSDNRLPGNNVSVPGVNGAESAPAAAHMFARFYNVSPQHWSSILAGIGLGNEIAISALQNQNLGGNWHVSMARPQPAEDGSYVIDVLLSKPMFVISDYSDAGGDREVRRWKLVGVARALGQTIIDQWELLGPGRSASGDAGAESPYMSITLSLDSPVLQNLTIGPIPTSCDTSLTLHFGWGYTKAQAGEFISSHSAVLQSNQTRKIREVQTRGNGLYDIIIEEETITYEAGKHVVQFILHVGAAVQVAREWGYGVPMSRLDAIKASYAHGVVGYTAEIEITRKDNCSFDYRGNIVRKTAPIISETLNGGTPYRRITLRKILNQISAMATSLVTTRGQTVAHEVDVDQDGTRAILERIETESNDTATAAVTTAARTESIIANTGVEPASVVAQTETLDGVSVETERLASRGNGLWEWVRRRIARLTLAVTVTVGAKYETLVTKVGLFRRSEAEAEAAAAPTGVGVETEASVEVEPDGMARLRKQTRTKAPFLVSGLRSGTALEPATSSIGLHVDAAATAASALGTAPTRGQLREFQLLPEKDGTGQYRLVEVSGGEYVAAAVKIAGNGLFEIHETKGRNVLNPADHNLEPTQYGTFVHEINQRGLHDFAKRLLTMAGGAATLTVEVRKATLIEEDRQIKYVEPTLRKRQYDDKGRLERITEVTMVVALIVTMQRTITETTTRTYSLEKIDADTVSDGESVVQHNEDPGFWVRDSLVRVRGAWSSPSVTQHVLATIQSTDVSS